MKKAVIGVVGASILMTGCANMSNQEQGQIVGVALGTIAAHNLSKGHADRGLALVLGALAGGYIGNAVGAELDARDREMLGNATHDALEYQPDHAGMEWNNPNSGNSGLVYPTNTWQTSSGQYCREYTQVVEVAGEQQQAYGKACRMPDGQWQIQ